MLLSREPPLPIAQPRLSFTASRLPVHPVPLYTDPPPLSEPSPHLRHTTSPL
jgi:hypothetical protein